MPQTASDYDNLTKEENMKEEKRDLGSLTTRTNMIIKKAAKGSATVIMSREDYIDKVRSHLNSMVHHSKLDDYATQGFSCETKQLLMAMAKHYSYKKN